MALPERDSMPRGQCASGLEWEQRIRMSAQRAQAKVQGLLDVSGFMRSQGSCQSTDGHVHMPQAHAWFDHQDTECTAAQASQEPGHDADLCPLPQSVFPSMPIKKGIGLWQMPTVASNLADANVSWFYSWGPTMLHFAKPADAEFVPMMWSHRDVNIENLQHVTQYKYLLGFNEPDIPSQANMSVEQALEAWPSLMSTGLCLGSPAVADPPDFSDTDWLGSFMFQAIAKGYRVDFMCVHYYSRLDTFDVTSNVDGLQDFLHKVFVKWQRPIWLTEFAMINWWGGNITPYPTSGTQAEFLNACAAMVNRLPFVKRYAWFALHNDKPEATNGLYDEHGGLTNVGHIYQQLK